VIRLFEIRDRERRLPIRIVTSLKRLQVIDQDLQEDIRQDSIMAGLRERPFLEVDLHLEIDNTILIEAGNQVMMSAITRFGIIVAS
jgi:hypothetical protein